MQPLISVVIPVYNVAPYLSRCLMSVSKQTYTALEIIVVNDGSTDDGAKIAEKYASKDKRIRLLNKPNGGLPSARKYGTESALGEYVLHLDGDDYLPHETIEILWKCMMRTGADMVFGDYEEEQANNLSYVKLETGTLDPDHMTGVEYIRQIILAPVNRKGYVWGRLFRKTVLQNIQYQTTNLEEDIYMLYQIALRCHHIAYVPRSTYRYCRNEDSLTNKNQISFQNAHIQHCIAMCHLLSGLSLPTDVVRTCMVNYVRAIGYYLCVCPNPQWDLLRQLHRLAITLYPTMLRDYLISRHAPYFLYVAMALHMPFLSRCAYWVSAKRRES